MTEFLVCFNCCIGDQPQSKRHPRLDRNMIGEPMNFVHITHIGTKEMASALPSAGEIQEQMNSKGGYHNNNSSSTQV
ncbi:CDC42 small effector protein 2-A-like [Rhineura floridana]|uniref:CDC42 small effector protein 2-A-like n=1 Tax=Rhineura floridana TaxID=261503 RepID=UPI002AC85A5C|nr:CDC42 small effector protein 2-A-like [Rhineura floridana]